LEAARKAPARRADVRLVIVDGGHLGAVPGSLDAPATAATATVEPTVEPTVVPTPPVEPTVEPTVEPAPPVEPTPTVQPTPTEPPADTTAPTGTFGLSTDALWIGQKVTLTQRSVADDRTDPSEITRVVTWGDGTRAETLAPGATTITKTYAKAGRYTVSVRLTDAAGNTAVAALAKPAVAVTVPGTFTFSKKSVWHGQKFKLTISKVPSGTTKINLDAGDGVVSELKGKNQTLSGYFYHNSNDKLIKPGVVTFRATFTNAKGVSAVFTIGKVTIKRDSWNPKVKIKKPKSANRVSSWKTVRGTVSDKGAGAGAVFVWVTRITSTAAYCYTPRKTWKRVYSDEELYDCDGVRAKLSKGKWSLGVKGLKKGTIYFDALAIDWSDRKSKWSTVKQQITRN
jgi:hypothetical protein